MTSRFVTNRTRFILATLMVLLIALTACNGTVTPTPTLPPPPVTLTLTVAPPTITLTPAPITATPVAVSLSLFETPRDGPTPVLNVIRNATKRVDVEVYSLQDSGVINALTDAQKAGKQVRVILNQKFPTSGNENAATFQTLQKAGVSVKYSNPAFTYTHAKVIIADAGTNSQKALIMTLNLAPGYLGEPTPQGQSLNFGIVDPFANDVAQIEAMFNQDWNYQTYTPPANTPLVISPVNSRTRLLKQINDATKSIHIFAQEFEDTQIVNAVIAAANRKVEVRGILANTITGNIPQANKVIAAGGKMRYLKSPYQHSKALITDGSLVYIGSINFTATSLDKNRELGILLTQSNIATQMESEFEKFWAQAGDKP